MALHYLLLVGPASSRAAVAARCADRTNLREIRGGEHYTVLTKSPDNLLSDAAGRSSVLGHLFFAVQPRRVTDLDGPMAEQLRASGGRSLIERHWGAYVAIFTGVHSSEIHVLRDPLGIAPCYYFRAGDLWVVASDLSAVRQIGIGLDAIDWPAVSEQLMRPDLRTTQTCLAGVKELQGGQRITLTPDSTQFETLWSPQDIIVRATPEYERSNFVERLRRVTLNCVHSWASCYPRILVQVSGGLDSSIVSAALSGKADVSALTIATSQPEGDERDYARILTDHFQMPLQEMFYDADGADIMHCEGSHIPRPATRSHVQETNRLTVTAANAARAEAVFTGNSGDAVFCLLESVNPVADRILAEGIGAGAFRTARDASHLTGASLWTILRRAASKAMSRHRSYRWRADFRFLHPDVVAMRSEPAVHPWLAPDAKLPPGKNSHVAGLIQSHYHREAFQNCGDITMVSPLLSQPLVELCLAIPTWLWCEGGVNRAPARAAFARDLPIAILNRRAKGSPDSLLVDILERNRRKLTEWLCDGLLAQHHIVDPPSIRAYLTQAGPTKGTDYIRILDLADAEAWARSQSQFAAFD